MKLFKSKDCANAKIRVACSLEEWKTLRYDFLWVILVHVGLRLVPYGICLAIEVTAKSLPQ
jgi:hypothetical protein